jgi:hypothetical protein
MFPPACARLGTMPVPTGSPTAILAVNTDGADQLIVFEYGDAQNGAITAALDGRNDERIALDITPKLADIDDLRGLFGCSRLPRLDSGGG